MDRWLKLVSVKNLNENAEESPVFTATLTKDFGNIVSLQNDGGTGAKIRAKIDASGSLGFVEVLDGGTQYSDTNGPVLVTFAPPLIKEDLGEGKSLSNFETGEVFSQGGAFFQSLGRTLAGSDLQGR